MVGGIAVKKEERLDMESTVLLDTLLLRLLFLDETMDFLKSVLLLCAETYLYELIIQPLVSCT